MDVLFLSFLNVSASYLIGWHSKSWKLGFATWIILLHLTLLHIRY